jgi:hypothetical protein
MFVFFTHREKRIRMRASLYMVIEWGNRVDVRFIFCNYFPLQKTALTNKIVHGNLGLADSFLFHSFFRSAKHDRGFRRLASAPYILVDYIDSGHISYPCNQKRRKIGSLIRQIKVKA